MSRDECVILESYCVLLGFAATLPEHRGKSGQNALLAARRRHAREAGCDVVVRDG